MRQKIKTKHIALIKTALEDMQAELISWNGLAGAEDVLKYRQAKEVLRRIITLETEDTEIDFPSDLELVIVEALMDYALKMMKPDEHETETHP